MRFSQENVNTRRTQSPQPSSIEGTQATHRLTLPKASRLRKRSEFQRVLSRCSKISGNVLVFCYAPFKYPRLGITVSRSYGNAVQRNLFKRRLRETFRMNRHQLPNLNVVVLPKKGEKSISLEAIRTDFQLLFNVSERVSQPSTKTSC